MKLEDQLKNTTRLNYFSPSTEESYAAEVEAFHTHLAVNRGFAAQVAGNCVAERIADAAGGMGRGGVLGLLPGGVAGNPGRPRPGSASMG